MSRNTAASPLSLLDLMEPARDDQAQTRRPARNAAPTRRTGIGSHHSAAATTTTWLTPRYILDPLGPFDLDPCSAPDPDLWPTATTHYTAPRQNGLELPWFGRVWLNPPYTTAGLADWMTRMARNNCGVALLFARIETETWFKTIWSAAAAILFLDHRPRFHHGDGRQADANCGGPVALIGYGPKDAEMLLDGVLPGAAIPLNRPAMIWALANSDQPDETEEGTTADRPDTHLEQSWRAILLDTLDRLGQENFSLHDIYRMLENHPCAARSPHWKAKIRQTIARVGYRRTSRNSYTSHLAQA